MGAQLEKGNYSSLNSEPTNQKKDAEVEIQANENPILNEIDQYTQKENSESERDDHNIKQNIQNVRDCIHEGDKVKKRLNYAEAEIQVGNNLILNEIDQEGRNPEMKKNIQNVQSQIDTTDKDENTKWTQNSNVEECSSQKKHVEGKSINHSLSSQNMEKLDEIRLNSNTYKAKSAKRNKRKMSQKEGCPILEDMNDILTPSLNQRSDKALKLSVNGMY